MWYTDLHDDFKQNVECTPPNFFVIIYDKLPWRIQEKLDLLPKLQTFSRGASFTILWIYYVCWLFDDIKEISDYQAFCDNIFEKLLNLRYLGNVGVPLTIFTFSLGTYIAFTEGGPDDDSEEEDSEAQGDQMFNLETSMIDKVDDYNVMKAWKWYQIFY